MKREMDFIQNMCTIIKKESLTLWQRVKKRLIQVREYHQKKINRKLQGENQKQGSSRWIKCFTILLLLLLSYVLLLALFHMLYRARQGNENAELFQRLSRVRPFFDRLIQCFWRSYNLEKALFGMNETNESNRIAIAEAFRLVLTPLGIASIVLGYINSVKSMEVVGFRVRTIIERRYPFRIAFYTFQGLFVLLGIYASARGWLFPSAQCLLGALLCFIYSVILAYRVVISQRALLSSTRAYIETYVQWAACNARHGNKETRKLYNNVLFFLARHVVKYLSQRCITGELFQVESNRKGIDFCYFVSLLDRLCLGVSKVPSRQWKCKECADNNCFSAFKACFATEPTQDSADLGYAVLFELSEIQPTMEIFERGVRSCQELWELLLEPVKDIRLRAALARHLLCVAASRCRSFPMLLCGLVAYIRVRLDPTKERPSDNLEDGAYVQFLNYLTYGREYPYITAFEVTDMAESRCNAACGDLAVLMICMLLLEEAFSDGGDVYRNREYFYKSAISVYRRYGYNGSTQSNVYLAYAYLIFKTLNLRAAPQLTWLELSISLPMIQHKMQRLL